MRRSLAGTKAAAGIQHYVLAALSVVLIAAIEDAVHAPIDDKSRFLVLLIPVAGAAWLGGIGPGLVSLLLSCFVGAFLYIPPKYSILIADPLDFLSIVLYAVVSLVLIGIIESLRRSKQALAESDAMVRSLNADLNASLELTEKALLRQKRFTSDASHELKTPLTAIRARSGIALSNPADPEELLDHIAAMSRAAEVMTGVVQDLLLLAASDEGQLNLRKEPTTSRTLIEDAVASVDAGKHRLQVSADPKLDLHCDPSAVTRVLVNLLQNAVVHTPEGNAIRVACAESSKGVTFEVTDQGSGIPADHLGRIFDRFHRVDSSRDRQSGGSGLGLAIAKAIVEAHNGSITIESAVGEGTRVEFTIPK